MSNVLAQTEHIPSHLTIPDEQIIIVEGIINQKDTSTTMQQVLVHGMLCFYG